MKWEITFTRDTLYRLDRIKKGLLMQAHWVMYDSLEQGIIKEVLDDLKDKPRPHQIYIYDPDFYFTVVSDVHYKTREIEIIDVEHGDTRFD